MNRKLLVGGLTLFLITGTGTGVYAYNQNVLAIEETLKNAENTVDSLYNSTRTRLADDIYTKLKNAEVAVGKVKEEKAQYQLSKEVSEVKEIAEIQEEVYSTLDNEILAADITTEKITEIKQKVDIIKTLNNAIFIHLTDYLSNAQAQLASIDDASKMIIKADSSLSREFYNAALNLVNDVKNETKKAELNSQLAKVNEKIVALEKEAELKKEAERIAVEKAKKAEIAEKNTVVDVEPTKKVQSEPSSSKQSAAANKENSQKVKSESEKISTNEQSSEKKADPVSEKNDWDNIGKQLENHDWSNTGSGEIDDGGNTWETWE